RFWKKTFTDLVGHPFDPPKVSSYPHGGPFPSCDGIDEKSYPFNAVYCPSTNEITYDEDYGRTLYNKVGDFAGGWILSGAPLAARYLCTHSSHPLFARRVGDGTEILTREKESVRLGHGGGEMKHIAPEAMQRGVAALRRMKRIADSHGATVRAVATSAVREA